MTTFIYKENWPADIIPDYSWYEWSNANQIGFTNHFKLYNDIVKWVFDNEYDVNDINWIKLGDCIYVRFRNEQDYLIFLLKFGPDNAQSPIVDN